MPTYHEAFKIQSDRRPTFHDVTDQVLTAVERSQAKNGMVVVFSQHTTCSVMIQEASDDVNYWSVEFLMQDLVNVLEKIIPTCRTEGQYLHPGLKHIEAAKGRNELPAWSLNTDAHLRSVLLGRSVTIPLIDSRVQLGEFGRVYFADFDQVRARERFVRVTVMGE